MITIYIMDIKDQKESNNEVKILYILRKITLNYNHFVRDNLLCYLHQKICMYVKLFQHESNFVLHNFVREIVEVSKLDYL
jgi:hypothetical protein